MGQIRSRLQASAQHGQRQVAVAPGVCLSLVGHDERRACIGATREGGDKPVSHVAGLEAEKAPFATGVGQFLKAGEEPHVRGQLVVRGAERHRAGDEAEGLTDGTVAAHVNVDRVEGGVDDVDLALVHLSRSVQEVLYIAFVPGGGIRTRLAWGSSTAH